MKTTSKVKNSVIKDSVMVSFVLICTASLCLSARAAEVKQDNWGHPNVKVMQDQGKWIIQGARQRVQLNPSDLQITVKTQACTWSMIPRIRAILWLRMWVRDCRCA